MTNKFIEYYKNNPQGYWFKRKIYGWGWFPAKWQGWATLIVFIAFILWNVENLPMNGQVAEGEMTFFFLKIIIALLVLLVICYKTGESPKWQWGIDEDGDKTEK